MNALARRVAEGWYGDGPVPWLVPLVPLYILLAWLDRAWQRLRAVRLPVPVVVVGNVTVGGTGKTPLVIHLVGMLRERGWNPGVISRGHGGDAGGGAPRLVTADARAGSVGDEPRLIADRAGVPVAIGRDRVAAGRALLAAHPELDVIVADDGLQHLRLERDLELCVLDGARGLGNGWRLPAGPLRESPTRLGSVDLVIRNGGVAGDGSITMQVVADGVRRLAEPDAPLRPLAAFAGRKVHAVAGLGNPARFFQTLAQAGLQPIPHPRADHAPLALADLPHDGTPVLMTEKDAVKLEPAALAAAGRDDVWVVPASARFEASATARLGALLDALPDPQGAPTR